MQNNKSPAAFFDTFDQMPNPFKKSVATLSHLVVEAPEDAIKDYHCLLYTSPSPRDS